jgi:exopolysaccharide biosynthesis protein
MLNIKKLKIKWKWPSWKVWAAFVIFEIFLIGITSPLVIFYGPFENLKRTLVGTAMSTFKHQYIATTFLSRDKIDRILQAQKIDTEDVAVSVQNNDNKVPDLQQNEEEIKVPVKHDETIEMFKIDGKKSKGYLLVIKDPTRVRVGYTSKLGVEGQKTSDIAKKSNAVAAINGGAFTDKSPDGKTWCGTGGLPGGILIVDGKVVYTDATDDHKIKATVAFTNDGKLIVGSNSINDLIAKGVRDAISFGPTLIMNGKAQYDYEYQGLNPRTAIAQRKDGAIIMLVMDGRQASSPGASLEELTSILLQQGAWNAVNLDGGSSSTMYYEGEVINNPCDPYGERTIATAIYVEP